MPGQGRLAELGGELQLSRTRGKEERLSEAALVSSLFQETQLSFHQAAGEKTEAIKVH